MNSIQEKINSYVIIGFSILFVLLIIITDREMNGSVVPLSKDLTQQIVDAKSDQISAWIEERVKDVREIASQVEFLNMDRETTLGLLNNISDENLDYESLGIIDDEGIAHVSDGSRFSINSRDYYNNIKNSRKDFVISDPIKSKSNDEDIVIILYRVDESVQDISYISAAVSIETIKKTASKIKLYDGSSTIYDSELNPIGEDVMGNDENLMVFSAPISKSPKWTVMFKVPSNRLYEGSKRLKYSILLIGLIIGGLLLCSLNFFSYSIVKPIRNMQRVMKQVEDGNLEIRFKDYRKDELGQLERSFDQMLDNLYVAKYEKKEMEFKLIQEQVNPHFLYNTLDTIRWSAIDYDAYEVVDLIEALSNYFRVGLNNGTEYISIKDEISHIESYLKIYQARFEKKIDYTINCDCSIMEYKVIKVLLQPLVENALNYGNPNGEFEDFKIVIDIYTKNGQLIMSALNNGASIEEDRKIEIDEMLVNPNGEGRIGFGLYSINQRLKLAFGPNYGLKLYNLEDGVLAILNCPIIEEE